MQGRAAAAGLVESIKELTKKQLQEVCAALEQHLSEAIQLALNPPQPQSDEEQISIENQLVRLSRVLAGLDRSCLRATWPET